MPGATFFPVEPEVNHARVSYSTQPDARIVEGMTRLGTARKQAMVATAA